MTKDSLRVRSAVLWAWLLASCGGGDLPADAGGTGLDGGVDAGAEDGGVEAGTDAGAGDAGRVDAGAEDAGVIAAGLSIGLLAAWPLDGDADDRGSHALDLTVTGLSYGEGRFGQGLVFPSDGAQFARHAPDARLWLPSGNFTVSLWVRLDPSHLGDTQFFIDVGFNTGWWIGWNEGARVFAAGFGDASIGGGAAVTEFQHVVLERDGTRLTLYVGGVMRGMSVSDLPAGTTPAFNLGGVGGGAVLGYPLAGTLDDIAIWTRVLTPEERAYLGVNPVPVRP